MSKKGKLFFALLGALGGGGFFLGDKLYAQTIKAERDRNTPSPVLSARYQNIAAKRVDTRLNAIDQMRLHAIYLESDAGKISGADYCILLHDVKGRAEDLYPYAAHYLEKGMHVLMPDLRGCGESDGTYFGYGYDDRLDVLTWVHWILKRDKDAKIALHGLGCGAAAALFALAEHMPSAVYAVISDSSYTTLSGLLARYLKYGLPSRLPVRLRLFVLRMVTKAKAGYDIKDASVIEAVKKASTPVLFIHGDADTQLPAECARTLYANAQCARQLSIILGAGHAKSAEYDPAHYWEQADAFLGRYHPERL